MARREKSFNLHQPPFFSSFEFRRYSDFCPDRATMATIFSPPTGSLALPGEKLGANKESSLRPLRREKGQKGEKGRYTNKRCAGWIIREKRLRNVNLHCGEPSPTPSLPIGDRSMYIGWIFGNPPRFQDLDLLLKLNQVYTLLQSHYIIIMLEDLV